MTESSYVNFAVEITNYLFLLVVISLEMPRGYVTYGDQGDEYHYVLVCPSLMEERSKYIKRYFRIRPNTLKMNQLFNGHNVKQLTDLSR